MKDVKILKTNTREQARAYNGKRHKKNKKKNRAFYYVLLLLFLIVVGTTLSVTVFFNISEIEVQGISHYNYDDIVQASGISIGQNLLRLNTTDIEKGIINQLQYCDKVTVKRQMPSKLLIEIEEASPQMSIENKGSYTYISKNGRILEVNQQEPAKDTFQILGLSIEEYSKGDFIEKSDNEKEEILETINNLLDQYEFSEITCVDITSLVDITITYQNRIDIKIGSIEELDYKIRAAKQVISEYIASHEEGEIIYVLDKRETHFVRKQDNDTEPENSDAVSSDNSTDSSNDLISSE